VLASLYEKENGILRMCDWVSIAVVETRQGVILKTAGMCRYGLPEIEVIHVPPGLARQWCAVLTGVAFRFREEFAAAVGAETPATGVLSGKAPAKIRLPAQIRVNADDVGTAYCLPGSSGSRQPGPWRWSPETPIRLISSCGGDSTLRVHPADEWEGTVRDFLESVCDGMIPTLTAAEPFVRDYQLTGCETLAGSEEEERLEMLEWMDELDREPT
jgi:hypothetical protein